MNICEVKYGKYIAFKLENQQRFTRGRTLGLDYSEESIMYRIAQKEFEIERIPRFRYIDKSQAQFLGKDKVALQSWATTQNINSMAELIKTMDKEQLSLVAVLEKVATLQNETRDYGSKIDQLDQQIKSEREVIRAYEVYVDSYTLISNYKKAEDKEKFKITHFHEFQNYDHAKAILSKHKGEDGKVINPDTLIDWLESLQVEREILYNQYQSLKFDFSKLISKAITAEVLEKEKTNPILDKGV